ncbi:TfoX/Sxy family DNA transformation protein [Enterobacteriaceae bacterium ESL0689]|nr:TfoX/Sxy family DNA transformation protein [Enterobacteriaceae bacterium ESL0689]
MNKILTMKLQRLQECLLPLGKIHCRPLFGGYCLTIEKTVFAMMAKEEIYLRNCKKSLSYSEKHANPLLEMKKNGRLYSLNYYQINETLWQDDKMLLQLSSWALQSAQHEKKQQCLSGRLKKLPNISCHMELLLMNAGITDEHMLRQLGAKKVWLKLRELNKSLTLNVLYSLEGAITGNHVGVLPLQRRQELKEWASSQYSVCHGDSSG